MSGDESTSAHPAVDPPDESWIWAEAPLPAAEGPVTPDVTVEAPHGHPGRIVLGMAVLAAERLGAPASGAVVVGIGFAQQTADNLRQLAERFVRPPGRAALRTIEWAAGRTGPENDDPNPRPPTDASRPTNWPERLTKGAFRNGRSNPRRLAKGTFTNQSTFAPGQDLAARVANSAAVARGRERLDRAVDAARTRGQATMDTGRAEASAFLQDSINDGMAWAEQQAVPQMVDGLVPHLVDTVVPQIVDGIVPHLVESVVPQLIDGVMPEIRARVLPVLIDDLTHDPQLRELVVEQSRDVVGEAAQQLRTATASADDRVEQVFRRLVGGGRADEDPAERASSDG
jgi:hypothetical protein